MQIIVLGDLLEILVCVDLVPIRFYNLDVFTEALFCLTRYP